MKNLLSSILAAVAALLTLVTPAANAASLLWDANTGTAGAQDGSGTWATAAGNWRNLTTSTDNQNWVNVNLDSAIFGAGTDGTYAITLSGTVVAGGGITFSNSGYTLSGTTLRLTNGINSAATGNTPITVAANKTATINSLITYRANTVANITNETGATLNLGGGAGNSQYNFIGGGTVNLTAGTYSANVGQASVLAFNQSGGTFNITPGNNVGYDIGRNAGQSVNYTLTNATLTVNGNASTATVNNSYLAIGRLAGSNAYANTLTVQSGATVNIGTAASTSGELRIAYDATSSGTLDVQGGTVTIGTGGIDNKIYFFKGGSGAGYTATMTQSGGTVTANGIQFGDFVGTYDPASSATLRLSGGSLYVGAQGITTPGFAASTTLPVTIQLQGGTLGANQDWSSSLDMKLGSTGGGVTIQAANSGAVARNITLSGSLSDDGAVNGTLTKTGNGTLTLSGTNTYTGATVVNAGILVLGYPSAVSNSSSVSIASGATLALISSSSTVPNLTVASGGKLSFDVVGGGTNLVVSAANGVTNSGGAGSVTIDITGSAPADGTYTLISYSGALQGSGFSAYTLGNTPAGKSYALNNTGSAVELIVSNPFVWTGLQSTEWSTNTIAGSKNWTQGGFSADYANGQGVIFDETATGYTVDISVADVTPANVYFNNNGSTPYTLQGSKAIAGATLLTKAGSQTLTILNTNTYTGVTTISAGTLQLGDGTSGKDGTIANSPTITNSGALVYNRFGTNSYGGAISGSGTVTKDGPGTQTLTGTNTYTGATTVNAGTLEIGGGGLLGNGTYAGGISIASGAKFEKSGGGSQTLSGAVTSGGTLKMSGTGGMILNNSGNGYGALEITGGRVFISTSANALPVAATVSITTSGLLVFNTSGSYGNAITIGDTGGICSRNSSGATLSNVTLPGSGTVIFNNDDSTTRALTITSDQTLTSNLTVQISGDRMTVNTAALGGVTLGGVLTGSGGLTLDSSGNPANINGLYRSGQLTLTNANDFAGGVTIKNGTLESKTTQTTLGTGTVVMGGTNSSGATYITGQGNTNAFTINAPDSGTNIIGANGAGSGFTLSGPITLNGNLTLQTFDNVINGTIKATTILSGGVTGTGNLLINNLGLASNVVNLTTTPINPTGSITLQGTATGNTTISAVIGANVTGVTQNSATSPLILSATNTYTGPTTVNAGTMVIQVASLAASSTVSVASNAVLQLDFTTTNVVAGFITNGVSLPVGVYNVTNVAPFIAGSGSLEVASAGPSGPAMLTNSYNGTVLSLSWPTNQGWRLLEQTNALSKGLSTNWVDVTPGSSSSTNITVDKTKPTVFYRLAYP